MSLKDALQKVVKGEVLDDPDSLENFSKDASIFQIKPQLVITPQDVSDIKKLVKFVSEHADEKLSITPRSAGTDMSGGAINDSLILDMKTHFNKILEIGKDYAVTQPGVFYRDFEKETLKHDLLLPCYPASREINTVGGMVANNSAGEKTLSFGQTEKYVKEIKVILADANEYTISSLTKQQLDKKIAQKDFEGDIYKKIYQLVEKNYDLIKKAQPKVSKNSTGYLLWKVWDRQTFDLTKLFVGSQGTLGIITQVIFKLIKPKKYSKLLVIFLYDLTNLGKIIDRVLKDYPESFESYDDQTLKFATRFLGEVLKVIHPKNIISLGWHFLPEAWMAITHGLPKLVLMAEFTGDNEDEVLRRALKAEDDLRGFNLKMRVTTDQDDANKYWIIRRESFNLFRHHASGNMHTAPFIDDLIVDPQVLSEFLPKLNQILAPYKKDMVYTIAGHVGNGNFHIIPLMDLSDPKTREIIPELSKKVYDLVFEYHGSMSAEHNDGLVRGPYLEKMYGENVFKLFKEVKQIFDPKNIFNPHKKTDASLDYSMEHLVKS